MRQFCKRYGLNSYWAGKHWGQRKQDAEYWHCLTVAAVKKARIKQIDRPVKITFSNNDHLDCDNHAAIEKMIVDGLRCAGVLKDDSRRYFVEKTSKFWDGTGIKIEIEEV